MKVKTRLPALRVVSAQIRKAVGEYMKSAPATSLSASAACLKKMICSKVQLVGSEVRVERDRGDKNRRSSA
jgi:hypothetical protein